MKSNKNILIRVDASAEIGTGHVMRCLLLADGLKDYVAKIRFVSRYMLENLQKLIIDHGHEFIQLQYQNIVEYQDELQHAHWLGVAQADDVAATRAASLDAKWDWLIVDHYALDYRWESCFTKESKIFVIDDIADRRHECDILLDQNLHTDALQRYIGLVGESCRLLLGPFFSLLRDEFRCAKTADMVRSGSVKNIMVFFGGVDKDNYTRRTIEILAESLDANINVDVVIGSNHSARDEIAKSCQKNSYTLHVQIENISQVMQRADLAIAAGGTSVWERCSLGLPSICFSVAENQMEQLNSAAAHGLLLLPDDDGFEFSLKNHLHVIINNTNLRSYISRQCLDKVGVKGLDYVLANLGFTGVHIRPAHSGDSDSLYVWRNHPEIRKYSGNQSIIEKVEHDNWLRTCLDNANSYLLIGEIENREFGVVRFDVDGNSAHISIYLVPDYISKGYGYKLLKAAEIWCEENLPNIESIKAMVLARNARSEKLFEHSGYIRQSSTYVKRLATV